MMTTFSALFDACVLYPAPIRDILMQVALTDLFRAKWTEKIHEEWISNLLENREDLTREQLNRTKNLMNRHARDPLVTNYKYLIDSIELPDEDDRHVVAAAIHGRADVIVTYNLKDFPEDILSPYNLEAQHPDTFLSHLVDLNHAKICSSVKKVRNRLKDPPKTIDEYIQTLDSQELNQFTSYLRDYKKLL
ncbi:MAG: PIN domain-containing protein [bacterium]